MTKVLVFCFAVLGVCILFLSKTGWCMSFMKDLSTAVRTPPLPIERQMDKE